MVRVARNISLSLLLVYIGVFSKAQSKQKQIIDISFSNISVEQSLQLLAEKIDAKFSYNAAKFPIDKTVNQSFEKTKVLEVVQLLLHEEVELIEKGNYLIIRSTGIKKVPKRLVEFSGTVTDYISQKPIPSVSVLVLESKGYAVTDKNGSYKISLEYKKNFAELVFATQGYENEVVVIEPKESLQVDVRLKINTAKKIESKELGAIVTVSSRPVFQENPVANALVNEEQRKLTDDLVGFFQDRAYQVSVLPGIGTNGPVSSIVDNKISLNVLAGYNHGVEGFEVGGLVNIIEEDVTGLQVAGIGNVVGRNTLGLQTAGVFNHNLGSVTGIQVAGVSNTSLDTVYGIQASGFSNVATKKVTGIQAAGFTNIVKDGIEGMQAAGFANYSNDQVFGVQGAGFMNVSRGAVTGIQVAGFANFSNGGVDGFQGAGFLNISRREINGGQVAGFLNIANKVDGFQIGLINFCNELKGFPIGLVNIIRNGYVRHEFMAADLLAFNYSLKSGIRPFYTIWRFSYSERSNTQLWGAAFGLGTNIKVWENKITTDINLLGGNLNRAVINDFQFRFLTKMEWNVAARIQKHVELFGGASLNLTVEDQIADSVVGQFVDNAQTYKVDFVTLNNWVGYQAGIRFNISGAE